MRRQSSLDTFDRRPMRREREEFRIPPNVPIPLPRRRSPSRARRAEYDEYEDIHIRDYSPRGYRDVEIMRERSKVGRRRDRARSDLRSISARSDSTESFEEISRHSSPGPELKVGKKGKTRMPRRLVRKEAIIELGYPFEEEVRRPISSLTHYAYCHTSLLTHTRRRISSLSAELWRRIRLTKSSVYLKTTRDPVRQVMNASGKGLHTNISLFCRNHYLPLRRNHGGPSSPTSASSRALRDTPHRMDQPTLSPRCPIRPRTLSRPLNPHSPRAFPSSTNLHPSSRSTTNPRNHLHQPTSTSALPTTSPSTTHHSRTSPP